MQFLGTLPIHNLLASKRTLKRLARDFASVSAIDFFPGPARDQIALSLDKATAELAAVTHPDEPRSTRGKIKKLNPDDFQQRIWATRKRLWIDRMASAWLIRRFIDPRRKIQVAEQTAGLPEACAGF